MTKITITVEAETDEIARGLVDNAWVRATMDCLTNKNDNSASETKGVNTYSVKVERREG